MELKTSSLSDLSDNQIKFLVNKKLSEDQLQIALAVDAEARRQGVNPEFVWPMVYQESKFQQDATSPKGAIGVMQLMGDTAKSLKVDPTDVAQNISGGISLLKELMQNPKIGNDPYKVLAGYNTSTETRNKFYESGDLKDLPDETITHMLQVGKHYGGELPKVSIEPQAASEPDKVSEDVPASSNDNVYSGTPVTHYDQQAGYAPAEVGAMAGLTGAGAGTIYSAKAPAVRMAQRVGLLPGGKPISAQDAIELANRAIPDADTPGGKWGAKTGYGMGEGTVQESSSRYQRAMPSGKIANRLAKRFGPAMPGESADVSQRLIDRSRAAEAAQNAAQQAQVLQEASQPGAAQRVAQKVVNSAPVRGGLAGLGVGYNVQDAYNKFNEGDLLSGGLSTAAAGASGLSLAPKIASKMNPLAVGLTTASQVAGDLRRGDKQSAAESGMTGMATLLPRIFGPAGAMFYSSGLNKDEERELDRRRAMAPTISP